MTLLTTMSVAPTAAGRLWTTIRRVLRPVRREPMHAPAIKLDGRLLADVGLTEQDVLGVEGRYWREREQLQRAWSL